MDVLQDAIQECASPSLLWLGQAPSSPYQLDPSLSRGTSTYNGNPAGGDWPTFPWTIGHRLHDIKTLCIACRSINHHDLLAKSHVVTLHGNFLTIEKTAASCRLCALIAQAGRGISGAKYQNDFRYSMLSKDAEGPGEVKLAMKDGKLEIWVPRPQSWDRDDFGDDRWVLGTFQVRPGKDGQDTSLMPSSSTASEKRIIQDLRRIIVSTACSKCLTDHIGLGTSAPSKPPQLPDRVIEIVGESSDGLTLRLLSTLGFQRGRYITLSHRWGGSITLKTTKSTLSARANGFTLNDLPRTFQDAVIVAKAMDISHIWIDSLCIVQDDTQEWLEQSVKMGKIYANSTLTIAAHSASQCNEGFLWRGQVSPWLRIQSDSQSPNPTRAASVEDDFQCGFELLLPQLEDQVLRERLKQSEISRRAWVLQELTLSPRILHFVENQLLWECETESLRIGNIPVETTATAFRYAKSLMTVSRKAEAPSIYTAWLKLVSRYTRYQMTNKEDKLVALAGIAHAWQQFANSSTSQDLDEEYHHGIFEGDVERSLLWYNPREKKTERHVERAPSWSWASVDGKLDFIHLGLPDDEKPPISLISGIKMKQDEYSAPKKDPVTTLLSLSSLLSRLPPFLKNPPPNAPLLSTCCLTFKAPFTSITGITIARRNKHLPNTPDISRWTAAIISKQQWGTVFAWCYMDGGISSSLLGQGLQEEIMSREETTTFVAISGRREGRLVKRLVGIWCLVVEESSSVEGAYQRTGIGYVRDQKIIHDAVRSKKEITLV